MNADAIKQALEQTLEMLTDNREYIEANERSEYLAMYDKAIAGAEKALAEQSAQQEQYKQANPLGGPAKAFDAMAAAIRAGDSYGSVLRQYGFLDAKPAQQEPICNLYGTLPVFDKPVQPLTDGYYVMQVDGGTKNIWPMTEEQAAVVAVHGITKGGAA